jgi:membrane-associated phospholipid phosphatase
MLQHSGTLRRSGERRAVITDEQLTDRAVDDTRRQRAHPALAGLVVLGVCYVVLVVTLIAAGLLVTHVLAHGRVGHWDGHVSSWFAHHRSAGWDRVTENFTLLADTLGVVAVAGLVTVVLLVRRWGKMAMLLVIGLVVELAVFLPTNYAVARPRPSVPHVGGTPSTYSWPSGHTAATFTLYGGIAVLVMVATHRRFPRVVAWLVAIALTVCVALSRIYRGEHHPTDTMGGAVLGVGAVCAAVLTIRAWKLAAEAHRAPSSTPSSRVAEPATGNMAARP